MTINTLTALAREIPEPVDYYIGINPVPSRTPRSVLQFVRKDPSLLGPFRESGVHHRFVLISALETDGCVIVDGSAIQLREGCGLLVFPFQSHYYARFPDDRPIAWLFTTFEYDHPEELKTLRETSFSYDDRDIQHLYDLTSAFAENSPRTAGSSSCPHQLALLLSGLLHRRQSYLASSGGLPEKRFPNIDFLQAVTLYIHRNINHYIDIRDVAREVNLSVSRLRSKFRQITGASIGQYTKDARIHKARELLFSTDLNVTQISETCGFESLFSFSRAFRAATGLSPSLFRTRIRRRKITPNRK